MTYCDDFNTIMIRSISLAASDYQRGGERIEMVPFPLAKCFPSVRVQLWLRCMMLVKISASPLNLKN
jgi:hypothetical protein